jgi:hypothetical protein
LQLAERKNLKNKLNCNSYNGKEIRFNYIEKRSKRNL